MLFTKTLVRFRTDSCTYRMLRHSSYLAGDEEPSRNAELGHYAGLTYARISHGGVRALLVFSRQSAGHPEGEVPRAGLGRHASNLGSATPKR
jgi:hypothetical protein